MPRDDIHYKVAISEGAKQLEAGELKKAESHFRFAVKRCADCAGGYRGLAKVFIELDDRATALEILRDGAQSLARSNNRSEAIELLREAVKLAPEDRTMHRRYAAALANSGKEVDAVAEYGRFVTLALEKHDLERARIEVEYARETLTDTPGLDELAARLERYAVEPRPRSQPSDERGRGADPRQRALALEARAQELVTRSDPQAAVAALEAARALMGEGLKNAAADLLLQLVATGVTDRDAQRLLVDVARALGRGEIARDKCTLLAQALRLDGRADAASEVERLAAV